MSAPSVCATNGCLSWTLARVEGFTQPAVVCLRGHHPPRDPPEVRLAPAGARRRAVRPRPCPRAPPHTATGRLILPLALRIHCRGRLSERLHVSDAGSG